MKTVLVFILLVIQLSSNFSKPTEAQNIIEETCKKTQYPNLCVSTLKSDPKSSSADVRGFALITLDKVLDKAKETSKTFMDLHESHPTDPALDRFYENCVNIYTETVDLLLPIAIRSLPNNRYLLVKTLSKNAASNADLCEGYFNKSPAYEQNTFIRQLSTVAADIISTLG